MKEWIENKNIKKRIIVLGTGGAGKTSLVNNLIGKEFEKRYFPTIGTNIIETNDFIFYDTAGQELVSKIINKNYDLALIVFSNTSKITHSLLYNYIEVAEDIPYFIIGTCSDLKRDKKVNDTRAINISNKTGKNIYIVKQSLINHFNLDNRLYPSINNRIG